MESYMSTQPSEDHYGLIAVPEVLDVSRVNYLFLEANKSKSERWSTELVRTLLVADCGYW